MIRPFKKETEMPGNAIAAKTKTVDNCDPQVVD
jgi:hypothetical protein